MLFVWDGYSATTGKCLMALVNPEAQLREVSNSE